MESPSSAKPKTAFLQSGGELGALTRAFDWAGTPLGTPDIWPQNLRITLGILLHSAFPMFLWWGEDLICFYNDAYRPSLGEDGKHPAVGKPAREVWPEIWEFIHPLIRQVQTTGEPVRFEDQLVPIFRNGRMEDVYWTFSYSAVYSEEGTVDGVLVTCVETTATVQERARLVESESRFRNLIASAPVGITVLRGDDLVMENVNEEMLRFIGRDASIIGKPTLEVFPEVEGQPVWPIITGVYKSGEPAHLSAMPVSLMQEGALVESFYDISYTPIKEGEKTVGILQLVQDVTAQTRDATELRYRKALLDAQNEAIPDAILIVDTKGGMISFNRHFAEVWNIPDDIIAAKDDAAALRFAMTQLVDPEGFIAQVEYCYAHPDDADDHVEILFKDGRTIERWGNPVAGADGTRYGWAWYFRDTTARKRVERQLMLKDRAIDASSDGICITGSGQPDSPIVYVNPAFERMTGYRADEIIGHDCRFLQGDDRDQEARHTLRAALDAGESCTVVLRNYKKDGTLFYNELSVSPVEDGGKLLHFIGIQKDITDRKAAEAALRQSEDRYQSFVRQSTDGIWRFEIGEPIPLTLPAEEQIDHIFSQAYLAECNDVFAQMYGYESSEELVGKHIQDFLPREESSEAYIRHFIESGYRIAGLESKEVDRHGHEIHFLNNLLGIVEDGAVQRAWGTQRDITEERRRAAELRESEARFRSIIEQAPISTCVFEGPDFRITLANEPMIKTLGKGPDVLGKPLIEALPELAGQGFLEILTAVYTTGETFEAKAAPARIVVDGVEETHYFDITFKALRDTTGEVYAILDMSADVTAQVTARQAIERSKADLQFALDAAELGTYELDLATGRYTADARIHEWLGWPMDKPIANPLPYDIISKSDSELIYAAVDAALKPGAAPLDIIYEVTSAVTGVRRTVRAKGAPLFAEDGVTPLRFNGTLQDITTEVAALRKLEESEAYFRRMNDTAPVILWVTRPDFYCTYLNKRWYEFTGQTEEEALGLGWLQATHPDDKERVGKIFTEANEKRQGCSVLYRLRTADGTYRWAIDSGEPRFAPDGSYDGMIGSVVDVHEQVTAQQALQQSKEEYEFAIDATELGTWELDPETYRFTANARVKEWFGMPADADEIPLQMAMDAMDKEGRARVAEGVANALNPASGGHYDVEYTFFHPQTGVPRVVRAKGKALFTEENKPLRFNGTLQDITAEATTREALRESEASFRQLADAVPQMVWVTRPDGYHEYYNRRWYEFTGVPEGSTDGEGWNDMFHPDDQERAWTAWSHSLKTGEPYEIEYRLRHRSGQYRWTLGQALPIRNDAGDIVKWYGTITDIHEQKLAEDALRASEEKFRSVIQNAPAAMGLFVGRDLVIESPNQTFIDIVGKGWGVVGKPLREAMPELVTEGQPFLKILDDVFTTGVPFLSPGSLVKIVRDGVLTDNYYNITYTPLFDAEGKVYAILDIAIDVTAQVLAQKELEESELFARTIIENSPVAKGVYLGEDLIIETLNERMLELTGRSADVIGKRWAEVTPELAGTATEEQLRSVLRTGESVHFSEARVTHIRHGQPYTGWYNYTYKALRDVAGDIYGVVATAVEVTDSVEARRQLEEQKDFLQSALDIGNLGTYRIDYLAGRSRFTENVRHWFGLSATDAPLEEVQRGIHPDDYARVKAMVDASATDPAQNRHDILYRTIDAAGAIHHLRSIGQVTYDEAGRAIELAGIIQDVTAQVLQRQKVEEAQRQILESFEQSPVAIALIDEEGLTFRMVNPFYAQLVGRTPEELVDKPLLEALPEIEGQGFDDLLRNVISTGVAYVNNETSVQLRRGGELETRYVDLHYQPRFADDGRATGVLVIATDITAAVLARRVVEENEQKLRSLVEGAPFPIGLYVGREMRIQLANRSIIKTWGKGADVVGKTYHEVLPELAGTGIYEQLEGVYDTGKPFHAKNQRVDLVVNGELRPHFFNYSFTPVVDADGKVYGVMNTAANVTDIALARQRAEDAEASLRDAVELAELATWEVDAATGTGDCSERLRLWIGMMEDEEPLTAFMEAVHPEDRTRVAEGLQRALSLHADGYYDEEYRLINRFAARQRIIHAQGRAIADASGKAVRISGTAQDVTKERALQAELERQVQERTAELAEAARNLQRSNEELSQYAYVASHDLQEPLRKIQMFSSILDKQQGLPESAPPVIGRITQAAERMSSLIQGLLEFSRLLNSDAMKRPVNLNEVVTDIVRDFELVVAEKGASVSIGNLPTTEAVALQMNQLFYNLIGNALKFSKPDVAPEIRVESRAASAQTIAAYLPTAAGESFCHITVSDNGIGFETRYADQIFEVFKRLHTRDVYPGSGIGLALCRRIVEGHGGALWADSTPGTGTTFNILLPNRKAEFISAFPEPYVHGSAPTHTPENENQAWR